MNKDKPDQQKLKGVEVRKEMPKKWEGIKAKLLEAVPSRNEGINVETVTGFIKNLGLEVKDFVLFDKNDFEKIKQIFADAGFKDRMEKFDGVGFYNPELDIVFVERREDYEKVNGVIYTEGFLVHELAHASSGYGEFVYKKEDGKITTMVGVPRVGFALPQNKLNWGWFLEEGFADMVRASYVGKHIPQEQKDKLMDKLGYDKDWSIESTALSIEKQTGYKYRTPAKYLYLTPEGNLTIHASVIAGVGLELLCKRNQELFQLLLNARTDLAKLKEIPATINKLLEDAYPYLQKLDYTDDDFTKGVRFIIENLYQGELKLNESKEIVV